MNDDSWKDFEQIIQALLNHTENKKADGDTNSLSNETKDLTGINRAFLLALSGDPKAEHHLSLMTFRGQDTNSVLEFYRRGLQLIRQEIEESFALVPEFLDQVRTISQRISEKTDMSDEDFAEQTWALFFPEGAYLRESIPSSIENLKKKRIVTTITPNPNPINSPAKEILFTSNILLTIPTAKNNLNSSCYNKSMVDILDKATNEEQLYWYDHPIPIGIEPEKNEVLYGMKGLNDAVAYEKKNKNLNADETITCVLSASVTHERLHEIAKPYIEEEFQKSGSLENIDLYIFTETETQRLINDVLVPAATHFLGIGEEKCTNLLKILGVDGMYGRHYSFLKAINALWLTFIDPIKRATFKIDLDQIFPQDDLVRETGKSAFEHLCSPLWGADGVDHQGHPVHLGMIAGALVNEKDISKGLFTPDVPIPINHPSNDEFIFFSKLPQAISTQAEMMTRSDATTHYGEDVCSERIHVTGGTNGILVESLFKYRPFTPSFFGRAEDQAYILSTFQNQKNRLAYLHQSGLIMRHDKEAFAQEAMAMAATGKLIGDYTRILLFTAYADILEKDTDSIKEIIDPFTGCFVSKIPITVVFLRFALKAASLLAHNKISEAKAFMVSGAARIQKTINFIENDMKDVYEKEVNGWALYYNTLEACQKALHEDDHFVLELKKKAQSIIDNCRIQFQS